MEEYVERLARLRLRITTHMLRTAENKDELQNELNEEVDYIYKHGISEPEFRALG